MNVLLQREIEDWVTNELRHYGIENEIYPVFWTVAVMSKEELLENKGYYHLDNKTYFSTPDVMSELCLHIKLINEEKKTVDKLLFLAPFWEEEQPIIKEVIKLLFSVLQSELVRVRESY